MTKKKEKISLYHPKFGHFEALGNTVKEASKNCLTKIAKNLKDRKVAKKDIKMYLNQASKLIIKKVSKNS